MLNINTSLRTQGYYRAAHSLARTARQMSRQLWKPATESDGIPYDVLCTFATAFSEWKDEYLNVVGVPSNFEGEWDFVTVEYFHLSVHLSSAAASYASPSILICLFC